VAEWQSKLAPKLAEEDTHPPYDIHAYGADIMHRVAEENEKKELEKETPVDFSSVVQSKPRYEVCRYFLATLQLANNLNVEIGASSVPSLADGGATDMLSMQLQLLDLEARTVDVSLEKRSQQQEDEASAMMKEAAEAAAVAKEEEKEEKEAGTRKASESQSKKKKQKKKNQKTKARTTGNGTGSRKKKKKK